MSSKSSSPMKFSHKTLPTSGYLLANLNQRVYPLNLNRPKSLLKKPLSVFKPSVPEFIREFVKDPATAPKSPPKSSISHTRSVSYKFARGSQPQTPNKPASFIVPQLSYRDFKSKHQSSQQEKYYLPQAIQLNKRSKIVLYSSKPIVINPEIYKPGGPRSRPNSQSADLSNLSGLSYSEKIVKLKALVASNV